MATVKSEDRKHVKQEVIIDDQFSNVFLIDGESFKLTNMPDGDGIRCTLLRDSYALIYNNMYSNETYGVKIHTLPKNELPLKDGYANTPLDFAEYVTQKSTHHKIQSNQYSYGGSSLRITEQRGTNTTRTTELDRSEATDVEIERISAALTEAGLLCTSDEGSVAYIPTHRDLIELLNAPFTLPNAEPQASSAVSR